MDDTEVVRNNDAGQSEHVRHSEHAGHSEHVGQDNNSILNKQTNEDTPRGKDAGHSEHSKEAMRSKFDKLLELLDDSSRIDLYNTAIRSLLELAENNTDTLNLKIAASALREMTQAFSIFQPYAGIKKVTFFGSSRIQNDDALYNHTKELAKRLAGLGWMTVTGAGPGIMSAAIEGAGRDMSLGVNIRLPHEQYANPFIANDPKLVEMRYFFTRKLMLIKESDAYVVLPGGFGTMDESFELLTLLQTGKMNPAPVILLDAPGGTYWNSWYSFLGTELIPLEMIHRDDTALFMITSSIDASINEITHFYSNYHSLRFVGDILIIRHRHKLVPDQLENLATDFADIALDGIIRKATPLPPERTDNDNLDMERIALKFDKSSYGRLRMMIDRINSFQ